MIVIFYCNNLIMKATLIALLFASASALRVTDGPDFFNEPTWNERMPSAGGFLQVSACLNAEIDGVTCSPPNNELFATGMNGDEDLGQDIIMKGKPFHYDQQSFVQIEASPVSDEAEKVSVLQTPSALGHTTFYAQKQ